MGDTRGLTTRREILKRGAIVGGGILWVTPVVQTLGMGTAFAQPVSGGADRCAMTPEPRSCLRPVVGSTAYTVEFWAYIGPGCKCNPLPSTHWVYLAINGNGLGAMTAVGSSDPGWYRVKNVPVTVGNNVTVRCAVKDGVTIDESASLKFTQEIANVCDVS